MPSRLQSVEQLDFNPRHEVCPSPRQWRDQFIYQLLIDRFDDNKEHPPYNPETARRGRDRNKAGTFQGGTIKGITRRLDYIQGLGCTAIWMSPPFKSRQDDPGSYHGYGIQDFLAVDPRFGTTDDLRELVREAHRRGMYVILDIVINHTADVFRYKGDGPHPFNPDGRYEFGHWHKINPGEEIGPDDAVWPIELQDPDAFSRRGSITNLTSATPEEAVAGDFYALKDLDLGNPKVLDTVIKCFKYWICEYDIDGYRIDTVGNVPPKELAIFCNAIREYAHRIGKHDFLMYGELIGDDDLLHKYVGSNVPVPGTDEWFPHLDAVLDFPLYAILEEVIKGTKTCGDLRARYDYFRKYFRHFGEAGKYYVTFIDNHDQSHRPWRRLMNNEPDPRIAVLGIGYLLGNLGIPCIYYGTEQGFDGGGDSDVYIRETMFGGTWGAFDTTGVHFFNPDNPIYKGIAEIAEIRKANQAMRYGRQYFRNISGDGKQFGCPMDGNATLAFSRILDTQEILIAMNLHTEPRNDFINVGKFVSPPGSKMQCILGGDETYTVAESPDGTAAVRVALAPRQIKILRTV